MINGVVGRVRYEVVVGLTGPGENLGGVLEQVRLPLIGVATHEPIEVVEAHTRRPLIERTSGAVLKSGRVVVLSEPGRGVAVLLQDLADRSVLYADDRVIAGIAGCLLGDDAETR